jgi:hypothetical protein
MASRSIKVRQVFAELRHALGTEIPAGELLRLAAALVDASNPRDHEACDAGPGLARDRVPLDKAFADGGWRIMGSEPNWVTATNWDDDPRSAVSKARAIKMELAA